MRPRKLVEAIYQKMTQVEHILLRPEIYIGPIETLTEAMWVLDDDGTKFVNRRIEYCPGLYKIFDQIIVNAADNFQRDNKMKKIEINIDRVKGVSVLNDGDCIPIVIHKQYNVYVAELVFGHLLTGSNYQDKDKKVTGGRNGYGAKLANIFSTRFTVETVDASLKKTLKIEWKDNMTKLEGPQVTRSQSVENYTKISFCPDFKRFGLKFFSEDMIQLMKKRVYDLAGTLKVKVYLNGQLLKIKSFEEYVSYYSNSKAITLEASKRWKVVLKCSETQFQQVSFVNSICTYKGGTHINYIMDQLVDRLMIAVHKKAKNLDVKPIQIRNFFFLFVSCLIENPVFDSQTKENLVVKTANYGSDFVLSEKSMKEILETGVVDRIIASIHTKDTQKVSKQLKVKKGERLIIPKLDDANMAGRGSECTLILTEGDSAKALAVCGLSVIGRDNYGVFPLRGKPLNVNQLTAKQVTENEELKNVVQILGLQFNKVYHSTKDLRYQSVMIMADQDNDGSHIKGLLLNFFATFWPSLCKVEGFLKEFITPIIKCRKGDQVVSFFTQYDYEKWQRSTNMVGWKIKYYKGLGTSTSIEGREYFTQLRQHQIRFDFEEHDFRTLDMAFGKKLAHLRKEWLEKYDPSAIVDHNKKVLTVSNFVNKELIHFSNADNIRSIPSIVDGLKPSQRKILYACFKRNLKSEIKVAQLAGYVAEHSLYHHGQQSLQQTIVSLAQNFVGSNNLNLLMPIGQFGTRSMGGKDSASSRYIFTHLNPLTRLLFHEADDHIVEYLEEDNSTVQPKYYYPILPLILINGTEGIGTGWSTIVPPHKVRDVIWAVREKLQGREPVLRVGWENYKGDIVENPKGGYIAKGRYTVSAEDQTVTITELPIHKWTSDYKIFLEQKIVASDNKETAELDDLKEFHKENDIKFVLTFLEGKLPEDVEKTLKLSVNIQNNNMILFAPNSHLKKYDQAEAILNEFFEIRMAAYELRRKYLLSKTQRETEIAGTKCRFINDVVNGVFSLKGSKEDWVATLRKEGYQSYDQFTKIQSTKLGQHDEETDTNDYNYLLNQPIWAFSRDRLTELQESTKVLDKQLSYYQSVTLKEMWLDDIKEFETMWNELHPNQDTDNRGDRKRTKSPKRKTTPKKLFPTKIAKEHIELSDSDDQIVIKRFRKRRAPEMDSNMKPIEIEENPIVPIEIEESQPVLNEPSVPLSHISSPPKVKSILDLAREKTIMETLKQKYISLNDNAIKPHPSLLEQHQDPQNPK